MNKDKYARLTIVLDQKTDQALRYISVMTDTGLSEVVRELISEPAAAYADMLGTALKAKTPADIKAASDNLDMFVEGAYGDYLRGRSHG